MKQALPTLIQVKYQLLLDLFPACRDSHFEMMFLLYHIILHQKRSGNIFDISYLSKIKTKFKQNLNFLVTDSYHFQ